MKVIERNLVAEAKFCENPRTEPLQRSGDPGQFRRGPEPLPSFPSII
jgi:hypothetical protein